MKLLMVSGDRQVCIGERGPFHAMQRFFSTQFERIDVLCPRPPAKPSVFSIHDNVHFHPADCGRAGMASYIARTGRQLIAEHEHALIVSHDYGWFYNGVGSARLTRATGVPYLSEIHHVPGHPKAADAREVFDRHVAKRYIRWARSRARAFRVVNAVEMPALLQRWGVPAEQICVLPSLYIDLELFAPRPASAGSEPEFDQDIVYVGRMVNNKGLDRIVDALALLGQQGARRTALFVGRGPLLDATRERARTKGVAGQCRFVEWVDSPADLAEIYRRSRVIVCASTCEGGPRVTVEAMACGTPAVSTPVGVMSEVLVDGENGRRADFTAAGLAEALGDVLGDEERRRTLGANARRVAERYEYERVLRGYADGLKQLAGVPVAGGRA